ncbi:MAG TPA: sensor histidine kinase [Gaiellaceae bacterium]
MKLRRQAAGGNPVRVAMIRYVASAVLAVVLISVLGLWLLRRAGEAEAIRDAKDQTRIAAEAVEPAVGDGLLRGKATAIDAVDRVVEERVKSDHSIVRVKIWDESGRIVYSDKPQLIGARYPSSVEELRSGRVEAEISDLSKPENRYERGAGRLLEVYLPIQTPGGTPLRFEAYYRSSFISARGRRIFREFVPVMVGALILLALVQLPLAWQLAKRVQRGQKDRERLLTQAIEASELERRRIARDLHDGVVQDLAAVSYSLAASAEGAPEPYDAELRDAAAETRHGIGQLRTLLVEIYPPELHRAGLEAALGDLLGAVESRGLSTELDVAADLNLDRDTEALFFRTAQEAVRNASKHAGAKHVVVEVAADRLVVADDGRGFDPETVQADGHFGLRMLEDIVREAGGTLQIDSTPGKGTRVTVEVEP